MKLITVLLAALVALVSNNARAETTYGMHLATYHADRKAGYDEINPGVYVMHNQYTAGIYHNSEGRTSYYAGYTVPVWKFDVTMGVVAGYARGLTPLLIPSIKTPWYGLRIAFLPPVPSAKNNTMALHLMKDF